MGLFAGPSGPELATLRLVRHTQMAQAVTVITLDGDVLDPQERYLGQQGSLWLGS